MKTKIFLVLSMLTLALPSFAQNVLDGVYVKEHMDERVPLTYPYLREADVNWMRRVWRVIDLKEKINLPLAYPVSNSIKDRQSLIDILMNAVKEGSLTAYDYQSDEFVLPATLKEIETKGGARLDTQKLSRPDPPYEEYDTVINKEFNHDDVIAYRLKEEWFFDKQRSVIDVRIIGIAPMVYAKAEDGSIREGNIKVPLCWFYYPECRKLLNGKAVFNRENDAERRSFDDIFQKRLFSSYIWKESNVYDRKIEDYRTGLGCLFEAEKIKDDITNYEHDMWEY